MAGPIRISILANGRQARSEISRTAAQADAMSRTFSRVAKIAGGVFAVRGLIHAGEAVVKVGGDYVSSLNKIQALTDSSNATMAKAAQRLEANSGLYAKMGQTTGDAASGVVELTKAGLSLNKSLAAVRATMVLAKAGELDVADASTLVANTLNTFSLKASQAGKIANGLANAANISSADVSDLAESFKYVSPLAAKAGVSLDQTNAILAELANSGVKASQAGTSFRKFLLSLQAPTGEAENALEAMNVRIYDAQGKMRPLTQVIDSLRKGLSGLTSEGQNMALRQIFGLTGITGAQIILKNGSKGLAEYTKGVQRAGAAQKLANAASKGFLGTLQSLKATGTSTIQSLYRQFSPKLNKPLSEVADWLAKNQDNMIATGEAAASKLVPALKSLATMAGNVATAVKDTAVPLAEDLIPALKAAAGLAMDAVNAFNGLPDPVKEIGVQAGIAALVLPRLTAGVTAVTGSITLNIARLQQWRAEMTYTATRTQAVQAAMQRLSAAARAAAGIGGLVLLAQGAKQANHSLGFLEKTAGGALLGFSVGGPWGAAIGLGAGALYGLATATRKGAVEMVHAKDNTQAYIDTLNQMTGATTRATRARIFDRLQSDKQTAGLMAEVQGLGVSSRDIVSAVMGEKGARDRLNSTLTRANASYRGLQKLLGTDQFGNTHNKQAESLRTMAAALQLLLPRLNLEKGALRDSIKATKEKAAAVQTWGQKLKGVPKNVQVKLKQMGYEASIKEIRALGKQYHLTPKQVRTIIKAIGTDQVKKQANAAKKSVEGVGKAKANLDPWKHGLTAALTQGAQTAQRGGKNVQHNLEAGPKNAKADLSTLMGGVRSGSARAAGIARVGGLSIGNALQAGVLAGFGGTEGLLAAQAAAAVRGAIAAAKHAGEVRSPSRKMRQIGEYLGDGLLLGMAGREARSREAGRRLVASALTGAQLGATGTYRPGAKALTAYRSSAGAGGGRSLAGLRIEGRLSIDDQGNSYLRGVVREEIADDHRFDRVKSGR